MEDHKLEDPDEGRYGTCEHFSSPDDDVGTRIVKLESENLKIREEFDVQRAKMKELFIQKEELLERRLTDYSRLQEENVKLVNELDEAKSRLVVVDLESQRDIDVQKQRAEEEIASLRQVIRETVEEFSCARQQLDNEITKLKTAFVKLQEENSLLRSQSPRDPPSEGPPISFSSLTKTVARKVASQLGADPDNLEESMRKAQDDAELMRSLVIPLEEEIKALKEKLRSTDDELQKCKQTAQSYHVQRQNGAAPSSCVMCENYEEQLVKVQTTAKELEKKLTESEHTLQLQKEDLTKEMEFRKEMEEKWNEKKEEHKIKVAELSVISDKSQQSLLELKKTFGQIYRNVMDDLSKLTNDREKVQQHLNALQKENESLIGKHSKHSQQLQSETINMPNNVEELHVSLLKMHEDLITAKVAQEVAEEREGILKCEMNLLQEKYNQDDKFKNQQISILTGEVGHLKIELDKRVKEQLSHLEKEEKLDKLEKRLEETTKEKRGTELALAELRQRVMSLQQELDTSEAVQKDFVRLSQSLQVQLERIRQAGSEVRWQHEEDVEECSNCHTHFTGAKKKIHCRHCGRIFCANCLSHVVHSGPKQRPSKVCDVCHTLLVRDTAPYFSQEAPQGIY